MRSLLICMLGWNWFGAYETQTNSILRARTVCSRLLYTRVFWSEGLRDPNQFHPARSHRVLATFVYPDVLV